MAKKKPTVFIVEDNPTWAETIKARLQGQYNVMVFVSGEEAVKHFNLKPKLIVLDYHLEGLMTGFDVLKEAKKKTPKSYVVMFSAQEDVQVALNTLQHGAYDYVVKGENALNRLKIILRKITRTEEARKNVMELRIRLKRVQLIFIILLIVTVIIGIVFFIMNQ